MLRVRLSVLLLIIAHLSLMCAELSHTEEKSSVSGRDKAKRVSCEKDCEDRTKVRKRSTPGAICELYYFAPTAPTEAELFAFWNNSKAEQLEAYRKVASFLQANPHQDEPLFFPAHLPLMAKHIDGSDALVLKDVYVRANGTCGVIPEEYDPDYYDTNPAKKSRLSLQEEVEMLEDYVERMPRSHWGYRVPKADEDDVCLDDTGLVVKDFPGIRTCFSMWIFNDLDPKPKHFAGRQIYNRINQMIHMNISKIGFDPPDRDSPIVPIGPEWFSLPALFLKEMCSVTNESRENRCTYRTMNLFYVSLCCCYTNRRECAYKSYKFPSQKKDDDTVIRACATGTYYLMNYFGGNRDLKNASDIASSVKEFVQERTSSEFCKWTYTWDSSNETKLEDVLRVELDTAKLAGTDAAGTEQWMRDCTMHDSWACCQRTPTLCPLDANSTMNEIAVECFCRDGDLCNKRRSRLYEDLVRMFKETPPCETHTLYEHLLAQNPDAYKKPNTNSTDGFMCPIFYNFVHPGRPHTFLQLVYGNNLWFIEGLDDWKQFQEEGCNLVEVVIREVGDCAEKLFGDHDQPEKALLILLCSVLGNPLGENRTSYPDAELKKTIEANLTAAKEAYPTCKTGSLSMDFASLSKVVVNNGKLFDMYDDRKNGTNDDITTRFCYVEVSFVYQKQYNFTFGTVSIDDEPLRKSCVDSSNDGTCVQRNSTAGDERKHFACCCSRHWSQREDECRRILLDQLETLLHANVIAKKPEEIMGELKEDPLTKCVEPEKTDSTGQARTHINRPCARNYGCYTSVHARDIPTSKLPKEYDGCVLEYAADAKKRDTMNDQIEARFSRICRLARNQDQCFAVLGTKDPNLPDDVKGPQMVCCCGGRLGSAQKCGENHQFGMLIGDFH